MKKLEDMEKNLEAQEESHNDKIYNLERKAVVDKDRYFKLLFLVSLVL